MPDRRGHRGRASRPPGRSRATLLLAAAVVLAGVTSGLLQPAHASGTGAGADAVSGSVPPPSLASASSTTPVCDAPDLSAIAGPAPASTAYPVTTLVSPPGGVMGFAATASSLYVNTGTQLITYSLSGTKVGSFNLPAVFNDNQGPNTPVVDPWGNIYLADYYGQQIEKFSPTGAVLWNDTGVPNPQGLFGVQNGSTWELVDSSVGRPSSLVDPASGAVTATPYPLHIGGTGEEVYVQQESDGNLLLSGNGYVETATAAGSVLATFGSASVEGHNQHTGSGAQFYLPGEATQAADGTVYAVDQNNLWATNGSGELIGSTSFGTNSNGGPNLSMVFSNMYAVGSTLYFVGGGLFNDGSDYISTVPITAVQNALTAVHRPYDQLGWGAGISTPQAGEYFPAGTPVTVDATFDPEWVTNASHLELTYSIWNDATMTAESPPPPTTFPLPTTAAALASIPLDVPAADQVPGPYQVQATLTDTSSNPPRTLGTTCMPYTVGAPGDGLDLASLPPGIGAGGPNDPRGVALNAQLGLDGLRSSSLVDWATFLPHCNPSAPTAATCGPAAMTFGSAPIDDFEAAYLANQDHVTYWVQVTGGDPTAQALVANGWWGPDIQALVGYYAHPPAGCTACAPVTNWEPWNEANNTGWSNGATYVTSVLAPFYRAVKAVLPGSSSTVIGGSSLGVAPWWWSQLVAAGGLADMDVASIHPYSGNNDSFEEDATPAQIRQLQSQLGGKPVWFSEVAWWSDGDYNYLAQADAISRVMLWMKALDVPTWSYFFDEGSWGDNQTTYSLVQTDGGGDDYVKPAALATMETARMTSGRAYLGQPATGIPQTYAETFGPTGGGATDSTAMWSDGLDSTAAVTVGGSGVVPVTVTDEYGNTTTSTVAAGSAYSLPVSGQITWISYPAGDTLSIAAPEAYGANLALLSSGATGTASSGNPGAALSGLAQGCCNGWTSSSGDTAPWLAVTWPTSTTIDRVVVDTQSVGSVAPGIRDYTVSADVQGTWTQVARVTGQFREHQVLLTFPPVAATGVRVNVSTVNFGGYYGGIVPPWWSATETDGAFLHALQVYAGSDSPAQVAGSGLTPLVDGTGQPPPILTTTTVASSADPAATGTAVTFTAAVTSATGTPGGAVSFNAGGSPIAGCRDVPLSSGQATCTDASLPVGTTTVAAAYTPADQTTAPSAGRVSQVVTGDPTTTALVATPTVFAPGGPVTLTATVTPTGVTGSVGFTADGAPIPQCMTVALVAGTAVCTFVPTHPGTWNYLATYHGDAVYAASSSNPARVTVPGPAPGLWMVGSDGGVFSYGSAAFAGSTGNLVLNRPIVGMAATPDGRGYWMVASDGGIFSFGDAGFYGSTGNLVLNRPIVGMAATPDGRGYWLVASDGGIFSFGDAPFAGSTGSLVLNRPIVGMAPTPSGHGYWLVASDGGIFSFGDAAFAGSTASSAPGRTVVSLVPTTDGQGYWEVTAGGAVFPFGGAPAMGSTAGLALNRPVVGAAAP